MKTNSKVLLTVALVVIFAGSIFFFSPGPHRADACGYGQSGGQDYVPQKRGGNAYSAQKSALTKEQVREIAAQHVQKLNPDLEVGNINDAGGFYEVEIISKDKEILQLLGVDKLSGRLMLLN
ncbi:MAG: hypothetical protein H8E81_04325 [Deltaproteobacteria bacterium]|nr:hypothetical protein [Deltaproteobacteria bacterium]